MTSMTYMNLASTLRKAAEASSDRWSDMTELNADDPLFQKESGEASRLERRMRKLAEDLETFATRHKADSRGVNDG